MILIIYLFYLINIIPHYKYNNIKINYDIEQFIINSIDSNKNFNIKKIKKSINEKFNILLSKSTIYNVLHKHKLTYKKITIKTNPLKSERELILKQKLKEEIKETDINNLSSYDEMAIYINDIPYKGWSKKGEKCIILNKNNSILSKRITLGMCITKNKNIDFTLTEGSLKTDKFINFINKVKIQY